MGTSNSIAIFISNMLSDGSASLSNLLQKMADSFGVFLLLFSLTKRRILSDLNSEVNMTADENAEITAVGSFPSTE